MDIDEDEVTREPFYHESDEDECKNGDHPDQQEIKLETIDEDVGRTLTKSSDGSIESRSVSSICSDDIELAKSYDIHLQKTKSKTAALYESEFIDPKPPEKKLLTTSVTSDCIHHRGVFLQKGDIVGLCDQEDGQMYFAQLTGFVQDTYCEKSASINWLVPIRPTCRELFDPADYKIGQEDTQLRKLDSMVFIRHTPYDYYLNDRCRSTANQSSNELDLDLRHYQKQAHPYIWTTMDPCRAPKVELGRQQTDDDDINT